MRHSKTFCTYKMRSKSCIAALMLLALGTASALLCPDTPKYNGCRTEACVGLQTGRRSMEVICDACGEGYILAFRGTKQATCGEPSAQATSLQAVRHRPDRY